jgi:hypothetical protein
VAIAVIDRGRVAGDKNVGRGRIPQPLIDTDSIQFVALTRNVSSETGCSHAGRQNCGVDVDCLSAGQDKLVQLNRNDRRGQSKLDSRRGQSRFDDEARADAKFRSHDVGAVAKQYPRRLGLRECTMLPDSVTKLNRELDSCEPCADHSDRRSDVAANNFCQSSIKCDRLLHRVN